eukprot:gene19174-21095_t
MEKEALVAKLNSLKSLVDGLKSKTNTVKQSTKDADRDPSNFSHIEKLENSSERLSRLAKATWNAKKAPVKAKHNKLLDNGEERVEYLSAKQHCKESLELLNHSQKFKSLSDDRSHLSSTTKSTSTCLENVDKTDKESAAMINSPTLEASSDRLSSLAKQAWESAKKRRSTVPQSARGGHFISYQGTNARAEDTPKLGKNKYLHDRKYLQHSKYMRKRGLNNEYSINNNIKDKLTNPSTQAGHTEYPFDSSTKEISQINEQRGIVTNGSTDDRLSNLAKVVWRNKCHGSHYGRQKLIKNKHSDNFEMAFGSRWQSKWLKKNSFLQRRTKVILKRNRYSIIKIANPVFQNQNMGREYFNMFPAKTYTKKRQFYGTARNSFLLRRQVYLNNVPQNTATTNNAQVFFNARGRKFQTDLNGRRLRRISSSSSSSLRTSSSLFKGSKSTDSGMIFSSTSHHEASHHDSRYKLIKRQLSVQNQTKQIAASRVVKKSMVRLQQTKLRKLVKKQFCMFYNRFGKCKNGEKCRYKHDPEMIAVCTRFLRGTCKEENCLFSHKIDKQKMPTCSFFLRGLCHKDDCPYAHVKVSGSADVCRDFVRGHCPKGDKCLKKHVLECSGFMATGTCPDIDNCKFYHPKKIRSRRRSSTGIRTPFPFRERGKTATTSSEDDKRKQQAKDTGKDTSLQIKPTFSTAKNPEKYGFHRIRLDQMLALLAGNRMKLRPECKAMQILSKQLFVAEL